MITIVGFLAHKSGYQNLFVFLVYQDIAFIGHVCDSIFVPWQDELV
jgi:hypothetical protein